MASYDILTQKLDETFKQLLEAGRIPGCGLKVRKDGELIYDKCFGFADLQSRLPVTENTVFPLASMTKPVIAVAVMRLVEDGKLSLDDTLLDFFPEYPEEKRCVTVRHLLNHCSGLGQGDAGDDYFFEHAVAGESLEERINRLGDMPFDFAPGESAQYSPVVGFEILGRIIEIASGMSLANYLQQTIFDPLEMTETGFFQPETDDLAAIYHSENGHLEKVNIDQSPELAFFSLIAANPHYYSGSGGLYSTLSDYDRFTDMLAHRGELHGRRIIRQESVKLLHTPRQLTNAEFVPGAVWGLGYLIFDHPDGKTFFAAPGTYFWSGAFGTHMFVNEERGVCATFMVSMDDLGGGRSPISRQIEKIVFEQIK